ncbi:hypothetical protein BDR26DRAFT_930463 [Obelidium mucronatum]|nr:hypothetical protein BDR26DRAFT_930463 [Obelidium mucronatum]
MTPLLALLQQPHPRPRRRHPPSLAAHRLVETLPGGAVRFSGRSRHGAGFDVGVARTEAPLEHTQRFAYFEITIDTCAATSYSSIGLVSEPLQYVSHPGAEDSSFGFKGQDGRKYDHGNSNPYGPKFKQGDVVGCGFDWDKRNVFFTINGRFLGIAFTRIETLDDPPTLFPAVGLHDPSELVFINLGDKPFLFNLKEFMQQPKDVSLSTLDYRKDIQQDIICGNLESAKERLEALVPTFFSINNESSRLLALLFKCQQFIEICRSRTPQHVDLADDGNKPEDSSTHLSGKKRKALFSEEHNNQQSLKKQRTEVLPYQDFDSIMTESLQSELGPLNDFFSKRKGLQSGTIVTLLESVAGLAAYENPFAAPQSHLLNLENRRNLAEAVNDFVLEHENHTHPQSSTLLIILHQLLQVRNTIRAGGEPKSPSSSSTRPRKSRNNNDYNHDDLSYLDMNRTFQRRRRNAMRALRTLDDEDDDADSDDGAAASASIYDELVGFELYNVVDRSRNNLLDDRPRTTRSSSVSGPERRNELPPYEASLESLWEDI